MADADGLRHDVGRMVAEHDEARAEVERLRAVVQAVRGLHHRVEPPEDSMWLPYCEHSGRIHPCPTIRTLDAALGGERDE